MSSIDEARDTVAKSLIELCQFTVTVPLSKKTKNIHTNSFIYFEPLPFMDKMESIYKAMGKTRSTRFVSFRKGYWYVNAVSITYKGDEQSMQLTLSPFPSVFEADEMKPNTTKTANNNKGNNDKNKGNNRELAKAKAVYKYFKQHYGYQKPVYSDLRYTTPKGNREKAWKHGQGNCADGANILETLLLTGGINARIKHPTQHYIVRVKVDGKTYWVDNSRSKGIVTWNHVWNGRTSNSEANITDGKYING